MKLIITAGGGGHFAPALSVLQTLPSETEILFIGRKYAFERDKTLSLEYQMAKKLGIPFYPLVTGRLQRTFTKYTLRSLLRMPQGLFQSVQILRTFRPDAVLSFGGYISVPVTYAAKLLNIPIIIHEQTMHAGLANKLAAQIATTICLSWETSEKYFPKGKTVVTGNPLRKEIIDGSKKSVSIPELEHIDKPLLYVTGGSLGSHKLNMLLLDSLEELTKDYTIFHQTGDAQEFHDYEQLVKKRDTLDHKKRYIVRKFVTSEEVATLFNHAKLILSRSGATTIMEILYYGKPAIMVPLRTGQKNEQETNAQFLKEQGLAEIIDERTVSSENLITLVGQMFANINIYENSAQKAQKHIKPEAASSIILEVTKAISKKRSHQK